MNKHIRAWYMKQFPGDDLGADIRPGITFTSLYKALRAGYGSMIYELIGVGDSVIRERLFDQLAALLGVDYDTVYDLWLDC